MKTFRVCLGVKNGEAIEPVEIKAETGDEAIRFALAKIAKRWGADYAEGLEVDAVIPVPAPFDHVELIDDKPVPAKRALVEQPTKKR